MTPQPGDIYRHLDSGQLNVIEFVGAMRCIEPLEWKHAAKGEKLFQRWLPSVTYRVEGQLLPLTKLLVEFVEQCEFVRRGE